MPDENFKGMPFCEKQSNHFYPFLRCTFVLRKVKPFIFCFSVITVNLII